MTRDRAPDLTPGAADDGAADDGAAVVEFVLVGALLLFVALGVIQVGLLLHARNVLAANAAEGARHAASLGVDPVTGGTVAADLSRRSVPGLRGSLLCTGRQVAGAGGVLVAEVRCSADLELGVFHAGAVHVEITGRSVKEIAS